MADETTGTQGQGQEGTGTGTDYKALWEQARADAEKARADADKWKEPSRKNEGRARTNAGAAKDLEEANQQMAELSKRLEAIEGENASLKAKERRAAAVASVAAETGVPEAIVASLAGEDEDSLREAATAIAEAYRPGGALAASEAGRLVGTRGGGTDNARKFAELLSRQLGQ